MSYSVIIPKRVQKQLDQLSDTLYRRIFEKLKQLEQNPRPVNCKNLVGKQEEYRIRVGNYNGVRTCEIRASTTLSPLIKAVAIDTVPQSRAYRYIELGITLKMKID